MPTNSGGTLRVVDNSKLASYDRKGTIGSTSTTGNGTGITRSTSTYRVIDGQSGTDRIIVNQGFARSNSNQLNAQEISAKINIDAAPPSLKFNYKSNDKDSPKHAPFTFKVSCSDVGSGVKSITMNGKTYNTTSKEVTIKTAQQGITYTAYCTDKAGNKSSTVTAKYYVQIKSAHKDCGVKEYKTCRDKTCKCQTYERCSKCKCDKWKYKRVCSYEYYCENTTAGRFFWESSCSKSGASKYTGNNKQNYCVCSKYSCWDEKSKCKKYKRCSKCACETRKKCAAKGCGVKTYNTCWHY